MRVLKFGGTSVGTIASLRNVLSIVEKASKEDRLIVVVSAFGGVTDQLLKAGLLASKNDPSFNSVFDAIKRRHLEVATAFGIEEETTSKLYSYLSELEDMLRGIYYINELSEKTTNRLCAYGELCSSLLITEAMKLEGLSVNRKNATELIITSNGKSKQTIRYAATNANITSYFQTSSERITVLPGFVAATETGELTTLGRGGSDYSAAILAAGVAASEVQIWTDVSGMFTANPKLVKQARPIATISYQEAMELSHFGAKVLYPPTIVPVMLRRIPIQIKNTFSPEAAGTLITHEGTERTLSVSGLTNIDSISLITLEGTGIVGIPGISKRLFETLSQQSINVILITQASSEHSICVGILDNEASFAKQAIDSEFENEIQLEKMQPLLVETNLSIIALVGDNMKNHQGISGKMFSTLGKNNINIRAIAQGASEKNISAVIASKDVKKALNALHERFFEDQRKQLNLYIAGVGNVGGKLINQITQQKQYLKEKLNLNIRVIGITNSRKMHFNTDGISLKDHKTLLEVEGVLADMDVFIKNAISLNKRNSIFVDVTASDLVAASYSKFLKQSIAVVACNKIACSSDYENYRNLKELSTKYNAPFLFETNVGAGLPIIDTLANLMASGDEITSIEAVLSGSLNFVFNNFKKEATFHDTVKQAQAEGYTEPDPRIDLSGIDVARKILILARESGMEMNLEEVINKPFLTEENLNSSSVSHFYETLKKDEAYFQKILGKAQKKGAQLKYVAQLKDGKASVGLEEIPEGHPFYNLEGKDNIVLFYTKRYHEQPLIIKGAGAGGEVTASGLFSDIIRMRTY
ncbi:bifunctional aspartate kinase/homoserine dehydrogenase I [Cochleicola gelatinilyticus]|uniref:Bifunctional aspartokinase I/homoserine dehydrogenase I n=1 Tax=Cochleicola gelatinilyticus TaxID=1763537 RepID=A0A167HUT0_9FLAO|nr:bifunctional aspartate kinase/homoserine dehydrogenase I [Cochleicola gelatinilyticus]OAB78983.1 bifunctional aspartokinase I/homoserine dehydrogenase I [Cochleicola gelatinilyticus]